MTTLANRAKTFLDEKDVPYQVLQHRTDFTAQETAHDTHTPGSRFAKTVVLALAEGQFAIAVLPANHKVDLKRLSAAIGIEGVRLATEDEMEHVFGDCDLGAEPPFGNLYGVPVYASDALAGEEWITFNAGTHDTAIRMRFSDFLTLVRPEFADLSVPPAAWAER